MSTVVIYLGGDGPVEAPKIEGKVSAVIAAPQVRNSSLPATGSNVLQWVFVAVLLVVGGVVMLLITRRQRVF